VTFTRVAWLLTLGFDMLTMFAVNSCLWKRSSFEIAEPQARRNSVRTGRLNKVFLGALILCNTVCGSSQLSCFSHITSRRLNLPFCQPSDSWLVQR